MRNIVGKNRKTCLTDLQKRVAFLPIIPKKRNFIGNTKS